jgi:hypothetical protein
MDTILIKDFSAPSELSLRLMASSKPILADAYELRPRLIEMVQTNTFLGIEDEDLIIISSSLSKLVTAYTLRVWQTRLSVGSFFHSL